ncbi:MAG: ATP-binding protein [Proteobacteria bacterium]|nr:ATP-binding protein [Pseudomonadota bacterium]
MRQGRLNHQCITRHRVEYCCISDSGPGIPAEYRARVSGIFERLAAGSVSVADCAGTGIGLSIARRIIESRHGRIWIENQSQGGATVVFELPDEEIS